MNDSQTGIIEVAIPLPLTGTFSYSVPEPLRPRLEPGIRVLVPFGGRKLTGYVLGWTAARAEDLKEIISILDDEPLFTTQELAFYRWIASYYLHPLGEVIRTALPAGINVEIMSNGPAGDRLRGGRNIRLEKFYRATPEAATAANVRGIGANILSFLLASGETGGPRIRALFPNPSTALRRLVDRNLVAVAEREVYRDPFRDEDVTPSRPMELNESQAAAHQRIAEALNSGGFAPFLLHGVTGSGKTEVYIQAIASALALGKTALVLTPEIALTPQLVRRFRGRFPDGIAVLHSGLSPDERYDQWRLIRRGRVSIVIGARSAIFAPLTNLGIIIVDEEHETSYKQSEGLAYNARDLALVRGKLSGTVVVLGSATPLVTSYHAALVGKLTLLSMPARIRDLPLPETRIIDTRNLKDSACSPELLEELAANLDRKGQSLLFLNRRGFATYLVCRDCGHVFRCPNCSVTLTHHRARQRHFCHYCDYSLPAPSVCPGCGGVDIVLLGRGTERMEEEMAALFPQARIARMDSDTTSGRGGHARILKKLEEGATDILIGTQMIAKGHDYPGVTLVGVASADATLNLPDFRAAERTFQLVSQVTGRAGRGDTPGLVLIQGMDPGHYALARAAAHDYEGFYHDEIRIRSEAGYPPFTHLALICLSGTAEQTVEQASRMAADLLRKLRARINSRTEILGPAPAPLSKVRGRFRHQILLKSTDRTDLKKLLSTFQVEWRPARVVRTAIDVDPVDTL